MNIFSADPAVAQKAIRHVLAVCVLPLTLFAWIVVWQLQTTPHVQPVERLEVWWEPLGQVEFTPEYLHQLAVQPPPFAAAQWATGTSPATTPAQPAPLGQTYRVWLRVTLPAELVARTALDGHLGLMINRIVCSGPWSVWADGHHLLQTNRANWGMQWNTPMRVDLPAGVAQVYVGLPVRVDQGFAYGSLVVGTADNIEQAWQNRELWMAGLPRAAAIVAFLLAFMTLPLVFQHKRDHVYVLFTANALMWSVANLAFLYDNSGNPGVYTWFGMAMDISINWATVLTLLFAFEFQPRRMPWVTGGLLMYAVCSSVAALVMKSLGTYSMVLNHTGNAIAFSLGLVVYLYRFAQAPSRIGGVLLVVLLGTLVAGTHSLGYVSNMTHPDHVYLFPLAVLGSFFAFLYALSRRAAQAMVVAATHQAELKDRLLEQKNQLEQQHRAIAELEVRQQLADQRERMRQDLHDGLGSNLTSALFQARAGQLSQTDTVLLLQELAQELRVLSAAEPLDMGVNALLAELRQRIQKRLEQGGIDLRWRVEPNLPSLAQMHTEAGPHLRAMLNEVVANAIKHAQQPRTLTVHAAVAQGGGQLCLSITDDGCGFTPQVCRTGRGLPGMAARAKVMGWQQTLTTAPGQGCHWELTIPL